MEPSRELCIENLHSECSSLVLKTFSRTNQATGASRAYPFHQELRTINLISLW